MEAMDNTSDDNSLCSSCDDYEWSPHHDLLSEGSSDTDSDDSESDWYHSTAAKRPRTERYR